MRANSCRLFVALVVSVSALGCSMKAKGPIAFSSGDGSGVWATGQYRNLFVELGGHSQAEVDAKIEAMKNHFFHGGDDQKIYFETPKGAYVLDLGNGDVRSEGMSYGMMVTVQLGMKKELDNLWRWAKANMQHRSGDKKGYFAWKCDTDGSVMDPNPAPDGEEYFAMALYFAWKRWGDESYKTEADAILDAMLHQGERADPASGVTSMWSEYSNGKLVCFVPDGNLADFTDPSYHLPAFYELWALWADKDNARWKANADASRTFLRTAVKGSTGLGPDYAEYDGSPHGQGDHGDFRFDAWRTTMNIAIDHYWWGANDWAVTHADTILSFFESKGISSYGNQYTIAGEQLKDDHSTGLVAMNAVAGLTASDKKRGARFVEELWNTPLPSGQWRYYDGCLYMLAMLHVSGNFQIWR